MACGTPVIAFENGSVPEVLEDAVTGFIVRSEDQAVEAVRRLGTLDRARIRGEFERRFTAQRMAQNYLKLYERLVQARRLPALAIRTVGEELRARSMVPHGHAAAARTRDSVLPPALNDAGVGVLRQRSDRSGAVTSHHDQHIREILGEISPTVRLRPLAKDRPTQPG
jgi:hypothetical protein